MVECYCRDQYEKSYQICRQLFEEIYTEVENGNEIRSVNSYDNSKMSEIGNGEMWQIGRKLQSNNFEEYLNKDKINFSLDVHLQDDYYYMYNIYPRTARFICCWYDVTN